MRIFVRIYIIRIFVRIVNSKIKKSPQIEKINSYDINRPPDREWLPFLIE